MNIFGQIVIGPPGSGKTAYCHAMSEFLEKIGRKTAVINLDPANDMLIYKAKADISQLITLEDAMSTLSLGPNGGLMYCMEYLEKNMDWLLQQITSHKDHYFLFDCPGQVELYTHHNAMKNITANLVKFGLHLCSVHLVDAHYCSDSGKFISALMMSLSTMLQMELPHVNVLSKIDLMIKYGDKLHFGIDFYTEVLDLEYLLESLDEDPITRNTTTIWNLLETSLVSSAITNSVARQPMKVQGLSAGLKPTRPRTWRYKKLNTALVSLVEDYSLVTFTPLNVKDQQCMLRVKNAVDKANGYIFGSGEKRNIQALLSSAVGAEFEQERIGYIRDTYSGDTVKHEDDMDDEMMYDDVVA